MMELRKITDQELDAFAASSSYIHYMKTSMWGRFQVKTRNADSYECLGFYNGSELAATAMVLRHRWFGHLYFYVPEGPCLDYENRDLTEDVFSALADYAAKNKAQFLRVDPNVVRMPRDINGNPLEGFNHENVTEQLISMGYRHKGYGYAYNGSWTNRYTLIADLSPDMKTVISRYSKPRRTSLNRHVINSVTTRTGSESDIPVLMEFEKQLSEQDGFKPHSMAFFRDLLNIFGSHAVIYVTEINIEKQISGIEKELNSKKYAKDPEARAAKEKELDHARENLKEYGSSLPIACGLFIRIGRGSWDLYTYNHKAFNSIKPVDSLHAFAMEDMKNHGVTDYDMCGFSGVTTKDDPYYGLYSYKRSFGPEFIERIGEFDRVFSEKGYRAFLRQWSLSSRIRRKYRSIRYLKKQK